MTAVVVSGPFGVSVAVFAVVSTVVAMTGRELSLRDGPVRLARLSGIAAALLLTAVIVLRFWVLAH